MTETMWWHFITPHLHPLLGRKLRYAGHWLATSGGRWVPRSFGLFLCDDLRSGKRNPLLILSILYSVWDVLCYIWGKAEMNCHPTVTVLFLIWTGTLTGIWCVYVFIGKVCSAHPTLVAPFFYKLFVLKDSVRYCIKRIQALWFHSKGINIWDGIIIISKALCHESWLSN